MKSLASVTDNDIETIKMALNDSISDMTSELKNELSPEQKNALINYKEKYSRVFDKLKTNGSMYALMETDLDIVASGLNDAIELIEDNLNNNIDVILEIDWQGARQVKINMPKAISIFVLPPSKEALLERLKNRAQDDELTINNRMSDAENQMRHFDEFDYLIINNNFNEALSDLESIIIPSNKASERFKLSLEEQSNKHKNLLKKLI